MCKSGNSVIFFYQANRLITVKQDASPRSIFRTADIPLAEQQPASSTGLLAVDGKGSVLTVKGKEKHEIHNYSPYGHDPTLPSARTLLGFNGEHLEANSGYQMLGNGYRPYSLKLMRFLAPDNLSPFAGGGINAFNYCGDDPVNYADVSGHIRIRSLFGHTFRPKPPVQIKKIKELKSQLNEMYAANPDAPLPTYDEAVSSPPFYNSYLQKKLDALLNELKPGTKKLERLHEQYNAYIPQQRKKLAETEKHFRDNLNRFVHSLSDHRPNLSYGYLANRDEASIAYYNKKIALVIEEREAIQEVIASLRQL